MITQAEFAGILHQQQLKCGIKPGRMAVAQTAPKAIRARGRRRTPGQMNATEAKYAAYLEHRQRVGEIVWYGFEAVTLKIAPDCRWTVDFMVMLPDGAIEMLDTKGGKKNKRTGKRTFHAEEDAIVKVRAAAAKFSMFSFAVIFPTPGGGWGRKDFEP